MIARISTEGQYHLSCEVVDKLHKLDDQVVNVVAAGDANQFRKLYSEMVSLVRKEGEPLKPDEIATSEIVLPPPDISLDDAKKLFVGHGLVPD